MRLDRLAAYPFLPQAADYAAEHGPSLEELLGDRAWASARRRGLDRVRAAIDDPEAPTPPLSRATPPREGLETLLAYVYARVAVSALEEAYVVRRHALFEAVRVRRFLEAEDDETLVMAAAADVGMTIEVESQGHWRMHFTDFLQHAVHLKDMDWKLVRQQLDRGDLVLPTRKVARLVQEGLRRRIADELPKPVPDELRALLGEALDPLLEASKIRQAAVQEESFGPVDLVLIPPCMKHILGQLHNGENVAHSGRFAITSFLHNIGMTSEEIMTLFAKAPDFREDLTRYQVEHITGVGSSTTYTPPNCATMQTQGICYNADETCKSKKKSGEARVVHPLSYYKFKVWLRDRPPLSGKGGQAATPAPRANASQAAGGTEP